VRDVQWIEVSERLPEANTRCWIIVRESACHAFGCSTIEIAERVMHGSGWYIGGSEYDLANDDVLYWAEVDWPTLPDGYRNGGEE
jgi:hypothetical protein